LNRSGKDAAQHRAGTRLRSPWVWLVLGAVAAIVVFVALPAGVAAFFVDTPEDDDLASAVDELSSRGWLAGFADGSLRLDAPITRQQFAKVLALALGISVTEADVCPFPDVWSSGPESLYPDNYIGALARLGLVVGHDGGCFAPDGAVTLGQARLMLSRASLLMDPHLPAAVLPDLPGPAVGSDAPLTRSQAAYLVVGLLTRVLERSEPRPGEGEISGVVRELHGEVWGPRSQVRS